MDKKLPKKGAVKAGRHAYGLSDVNTCLNLADEDTNGSVPVLPMVSIIRGSTANRKSKSITGKTRNF
jgi:hypothetical protein